MTLAEILKALDEERVLIKIGTDAFIARIAGNGKGADFGGGIWAVRVTGGPHPRKNGHGIISNAHEDIPFTVLN